MRGFNRTIDPLDVQPGLDELPGFVPDAAFVQLKNDCAHAHDALILKHKHLYSLAELKQLTERYESLLKQADSLMHLYATQEAFVFQYIALCERYAELQAYEV